MKKIRVAAGLSVLFIQVSFAIGNPLPGVKLVDLKFCNGNGTNLGSKEQPVLCGNGLTIQKALGLSDSNAGEIFSGNNCKIYQPAADRGQYTVGDHYALFGTMYLNKLGVLILSFGNRYLTPKTIHLACQVAINPDISTTQVEADLGETIHFYSKDEIH